MQREEMLPEKWDLEVDVVAGGTGAGGLTGAIVAHDRGMKVVVLEKSSQVGGGAAVSDGQIWAAGNHVAKKLGIEDPEEKIEQYLDCLASGFPVNKAVREKMVTCTNQALVYLEENAKIKWQVVKGLSDVLYGSTPSALFEGRYVEPLPIMSKELGEWKDKVLRSPLVPYFATNGEMFEFGGAATIRDWPKEFVSRRKEDDVLCQGTGLIACLLKAVLDRGVPVYTETPIVRIICGSSGRVVGVTAMQNNGHTLSIRARKGVILNIGGYDWHPTYPYFFEQVPEWHSVMPPAIEGDLITLAGEPGAAIIPFRHVSPRIGYHIPGEQWFGKDLYRQLHFEPGLPHTILVNKSGQRFADEAYFQEFGLKASFNDKKRGFVNYPCFLIFDQNYRENYPLGSIDPGLDLPKGFGVKASSLKELASILGVDPSNFVETVEKFNGFAIEGADRDFGRGNSAWENQFVGDLRHKPNPNLGTIEKPPFFGIKLSFVGIGTNGGYMIDSSARVLNTQGLPISGLYACGNCVAFNDLGPIYQDGCCLSRSIGYAYLAVQHISSAE